MINQCPQSNVRMNSGFTLVELIITLAVMGIVVSIAVPSFSRTLANQRIKDTSSTIFSALKEAKTESYLKKADVTVTLSTNNPMTIQLTVPAPVEDNAAATKTLATYQLNTSSEITMTNPTTGTAIGNTIVIQDAGRTATAVTYTVCDSQVSGETPKQVRVDAVSNILISKDLTVNCS